jgi:hypothetical protein
MMQRHAVLVMVLLASCLPAAHADSPAPSPTERDFFEQRIRPLLVEHCHACHSAAGKMRGGLRLDSAAALLQGGDSGPAVVPGQPGKSLLVQAVRHEHARLQMPPRGKLPARDLALLEEWVKRGAFYPGPVTGAGGHQGIDLVLGRTFWSFLPLREMPLPPVRRQAWPRQRIDTFLLFEMEKRHLSPGLPAGRETLIRRAAFDLLGLPPTAEEVEAFVHDDRPDAWPRLIDRLLASPHYGERWARIWLDLVRYCDVSEPWSEHKGAPHLYRDWVVRAFNEHLPYDTFLHRQLAADLLPDTTPADRAALGFLGLSPSYWKELKLDHQVIRGVVAEEWEERIHTLTSTVLGLTVACARCHDHKFDPISMQDYYAFAGVFASIRTVDRSILPDPQAEQVQRAATRVKELETQLGRLKTLPRPDGEALRKVQQFQEELASLRKTPGLDIPLAVGIADGSVLVQPDGEHRTKLVVRPGETRDIAMQMRGNPAREGPVVPRRFLAVLSADPSPVFRQGSGRLELARAFTREGGPLAARVIVNRVWKQHFGEGLVATPSDFGSQGSRPSHPELLDDLAARFVARGWSLEWLHREILLSAAYQHSSSTRDRPEQAVDPQNRWLWRMNRRRLEIEAWRDAMLAVSGTLDRSPGGPARELSDLNNGRRTLYGLVRRRDLNDVLRLHDFPDPVTHSPARIPSTSPLQQLFVLNSPFLQQQSAALARRLLGSASAEEARVRAAYRLLFARPPTTTEVALARDFLAEEGGGARAWERYAHALLASNEFLYID